MTTQPRKPAGAPASAGGQWDTWNTPLAQLDLATNEQERDLLAARRELLATHGYLQPETMRAAIDPRSSAHRGRWWTRSFVSAEYGGKGEFAQMPDDYTPSRGGGRSLSGHRRTHRMNYSSSQVDLRMPSATSIKRFAKDQQGRTFDVPVSARYGGGDVQGWVRVTPGPDNTFEVVGLGFREDQQELVAEAVQAVISGRRPSRALLEAGDLVARRQERMRARGIEGHATKTSSWIKEVGYDDETGRMLMVTETKAGEHGYAYEVDRAAYEAVANSDSPGRDYNKLVKGVAPSEKVERCQKCGRFSSDVSAHTCPPPRSTAEAPGTFVQNARARKAAEAVTGALRGAQPAPAPAPAPDASKPAPAPAPAPAPSPGPALPRTVDVAAWCNEGMAQVPSGERAYPGAPRGFTRHVLGALGSSVDEAHVPWAYSSTPGGMRFENGSTGLMDFDGADSQTARQLLRTLPRETLEDRQNEGPRLGDVLVQSAKYQGQLSFGGYVVGPDRADERLTVDRVYLHGLENESEDKVRRRFQVGLGADPETLDLVDLPGRPGEKVWRAWWD